MKIREEAILIHPTIEYCEFASINHIKGKHKVSYQHRYICIQYNQFLKLLSNIFFLLNPHPCFLLATAGL